MSKHYEYGSAKGALYTVWGEDDLDGAAETLDPAVELEGPCVLFVGNDNGDGLVIEGDADDIARYCRQLLTHVNVTLGTDA